MKKRRILAFILAAALALTFCVPAMAADGGSAYPEKFDLRDYGLVSSVKDQSPWGTCWGFAAIAASEISILSELRDLSPVYAEAFADPDELDLSELQPAWFVYTRLPDDGTGDPHSQAGEGISVYGVYPLDGGGYSFMASTVFSMGTGPVPESAVPYRNKEGLIVKNQAGENQYYAFRNEDGTYCDWSVDEEYRFYAEFEIADCNVLPAAAMTDKNGEYVYNPAGTAAIKDELMKKRGVSIAFCADTALPDDKDAAPVYTNLDTFAHYTWEDVEANHEVCIVGWDDNYPKENFLEGHRPPDDGAWIVKNSWGSINGEFPNKYNWGADGSGYFYLSYYDKSITCAESFDYDIEENFDNGDSGVYIVDQYDYLPANAEAPFKVPLDNVRLANVFTAEFDQNLRSIGVTTPNENSTVEFEVYRLKDGWKTPVDGEKLASFSKDFRYAGFHRANLENACFMPEGADYSIVVKFDELPVNMGAAWSGSGEPKEGTYCKTVVNRGESFIDDGSGWEDWADAKTVIEDVITEGEGIENVRIVLDNPTIKAYSDVARTLEVNADIKDWTDDPGASLKAGDTVTFEVTVKNPMTLDVNSVKLESRLVDLGDKGVIATIPAGETVTLTYDYTVTEQDIAANDIFERIVATLPYDRFYDSDGEYFFICPTDVTPWYFEDMAYVFENNIMDVNESGFDPDVRVTRAQLAKAIYELDGGSASAGVVEVFSDVPAGSKYADAVNWAAASGVVNGRGDGT
ncbi:MAG: S-layer homology domain-containing protein, partial [Clostridia bacterium]|nr:S-layer homology domain-containing protein [Clostridia bacterium]